MAIYVILTDKNNRLHIVNTVHLAFSKEGNLMLYTAAGKVLSFDKEKIKNVRVITDEAAVAGYLTKVFSKFFGQKEQNTAGKEAKNQVK